MPLIKNIFFSFAGLERLSSLKKLEILDLSLNYDIDNDILPSLSTLTSLKILDLSHTGLNGNYPISGMFLSFLSFLFFFYHVEMHILKVLITPFLHELQNLQL